MFRIGKETVALVADSACGLTEEQLTAYDISLAPLRVACGGREYRDGVDLTGSIDALPQDPQAFTAPPLPSDLAGLYRQLCGEGCTRIIHLTAAGELSGSGLLARTLAAEMDGVSVDVIDTHTISCGLGLLAASAARALEDGMSPDELPDHIEDVRGTQLTLFTVPTVKQLRKSGRVGLMTYAGKTPVFMLGRSGMPEALPAVRGQENPAERMCRAFEDRFGARAVHLAIGHCSAPEAAEELLTMLRDRLNVDSACIAPVSAAIAIHTGAGLVCASAQYAD